MRVAPYLAAGFTTVRNLGLFIKTGGYMVDGDVDKIIPLVRQAVALNSSGRSKPSKKMRQDSSTDDGSRR